MTRIVFFLMIIALGACSPSLATRGNLIDPDDLAQIKVGVSSKDSVRNILGSPSSIAPLDDNLWVYAGQKTERYGWRREKVTERRTLTLKFSPDGILQSMTPEDNQGEEIAMDKNITPTYGTEMTMLQQFFGNLGRFNKDNRDAGTPSPDGVND